MTHDHRHDEGCQHDRQPTPAEDLEIARRALQAGDHGHAAFHVTAALATNPLQPEWRALFDQIITAAPEPEHLLKIGDGAYFAHVAGYAYILARLDRLAEAFDLLCQVINVVPDRGYHFWAVEWLTRCRDREVKLDPFLRVFSAQIQPTIGRLHLRRSERFSLEGAAAMVRELAQTATGKGSALFLALASGIARRAGLAEEALEIARRSLEVEPTTTGLISLGLARRLGADPQGAVAAFEEAHALDDDPVYSMEVARALWERAPGASLQEALDALERYRQAVGDQDPECELTRDYLRCRLGLDDEGQWICDCIGEQATPDDVRLLLYPYVGWLPEPADATVNVLRQIYDEMGHVTDGDLKLTLSHIEAPSARLALALMTHGDTDTAAVGYTYDKVPRPDPREPRRPVEHELWRYIGEAQETPVQAVPRPDAAVLRAVEELAASPYYLPALWRRAGALGRELGDDAVVSLLGVMVHPSLPPEGLPGYLWIQRLQHAATLVLGHVDSGWSESTRRSVLLSLVNGAMDWSTDAAIVALTELALDEPAALPEVAELFLQLLEEIPDEGHSWFGEALAQSFLRLPGRPPHERGRFSELLEALHADDDHDDADRAGQGGDGPS